MSSLTWIKHDLPLSGELVLTDVHAIIEDSRIIALASGEEGVLLKLDVPVDQHGNYTWETLLDSSKTTPKLMLLHGQEALSNFQI